MRASIVTVNAGVETAAQNANLRCSAGATEPGSAPAAITTLNPRLVKNAVIISKCFPPGKPLLFLFSIDFTKLKVTSEPFLACPETPYILQPSSELRFKTLLKFFPSDNRFYKFAEMIFDETGKSKIC